MTKYKILAIITLATLMAVTSCTKEADTRPDAMPVVESYLSPGKPIKVKITREILYGGSDTLMPITGLQVKIGSSGRTYMMTEKSPGSYESNDIDIIAGNTYHLSFVFNGLEVTAQTEVPASPGVITASGTQIVVPQIGAGMQLPEPIVYRWQNPEQAYQLMVVKNVEQNPQPITFNLGDNVIQKPEPVFRLPPMKGEQQQLSLGRFSYYGKHAVIIYRIQPEYAALYEDNSNNSNNLATPPSNIKNGLGIFTAVNGADTLWVQVR